MPRRKETEERTSLTKKARSRSELVKWVNSYRERNLLLWEGQMEWLETEQVWRQNLWVLKGSRHEQRQLDDVISDDRDGRPHVLSPRSGVDPLLKRLYAVHEWPRYDIPEELKEKVA